MLAVHSVKQAREIITWKNWSLVLVGVMPQSTNIIISIETGDVKSLFRQVLDGDEAQNT